LSSRKTDSISGDSHRMVLPGMVGRQIEFAGATRNARAAAHAHQPFVLGQRLASTAVERVDAAEGVVDLLDDLVERGLGDGRIASVGIEDALVPLEVAQEVGLQVGPRGDVHDLEDRHERVVMRQGRFGRHQLAQASEQMLQP
jgi:hypothetical protein